MEKIFYDRGKETSIHEFEHHKAFKAKIKYGNLWITEIYDEKFTNLKGAILNFKHFKSKVYKELCSDKSMNLNTHIDPVIDRETRKDLRTFISLNNIEHFRVQWTSKETEFHRNKIQFALVLLTFFGLIVSMYSYCSTNQKTHIKVEILK